MAYTVKQLAGLSGVSVRTLRFYDQTSLLKPASRGRNRYRFYEEPQLLKLQQILFYRELGFELKRIKRVLGRPDFEVAAALRSHRTSLVADAARTRTLVGTIDKTLAHLEGTAKMKDEEMFAGFRVPAGEDRFGDHVRLHGNPVDCKLSARDTSGALAVFEITTGWPHHSHRDQDEWLYVVEGELHCIVADRRFRVAAGGSVFIPRNVAHAWAPVDDAPCRVVNVFQPAGDLEQFFRELGDVKDLITKEQAINKTYTDEQVATLRRLFDAHGMDLLPPPGDGG